MLLLELWWKALDLVERRRTRRADDSSPWSLVFSWRKILWNAAQAVAIMAVPTWTLIALNWRDTPAFSVWMFWIPAFALGAIGAGGVLLVLAMYSVILLFGVAKVFEKVCERITGRRVNRSK